MSGREATLPPFSSYNLISHRGMEWQMICSEKNVDALEVYLSRYGIGSSPSQRRLLLRHLDLVREKNQEVNLTRIVDERDMIIRHVVDSLLFLPSLDDLDLAEDATFVDIGTGAGFPGMPIGIMRPYRGVLIDSVRKKSNAVEEFICNLDLGLQLSTRAIRVEDLAREQASRFNFALARAVADLGILIEYASPLLVREGYLVVSKARMTDKEFGRGNQTAQMVGMKLVSCETYELPDDAGYREILSYQKAKHSDVKLPRATGHAKSKPLVR